ncbi:polyadenylate-binding protein-interacting protein 1 isoform X2 [Phlebotomus papatasi]|uniref:polyadenylate-binding protein-interacting protein 1 isoform X2 n=1 Tax=Phlebotomus papatasi TaxID=29031 RepID=UPI0024834C66|nr:polyadenylate-binding protein-interacting protein 1 isoform X2 [Phlebotomus papatasi]
MNQRNSKSFDGHFDPLRQQNTPHPDNMRVHHPPGRSVALSAEAKEFIPKNKMANDVGHRHQGPGQHHSHHPHMAHAYHPQQHHGQNFHHPPPQQIPSASGRQFPASAINHPYMHMQQQQQLAFMRHQQQQHMNHPIGLYTEMQLAQQMQRATVQDRLNSTRHQPIMQHHVPHAVHEAQGVQNNFEGGGGPVHENPPHEETGALDMLSHIIKQLTDQPGMYEEVQVEIKEMFADLMGSRFVMSNAVELIFDHSINESNFRYMGARLCQLLDSLSLQQSNVFRTMLCLKMNHHKMEMERFMLNEQHIVRGTTLFLAELYIQMQNDGARIGEIGECIVSSMALLLNKQGPENVKCVCQSLKLCGYELEIDCGVLLVGIVNTLAQLETSVDVSTGRLIRSVLDLKANRWGRTAPIAVAPIQEVNHYDCNDSPVFYGPDGQVLTEEESSFLSAQASASYPNNNNFEEYLDNDGDELADAEPEMDLEIQLAFREFVQTQKKASSQIK